MTPELFRSLAVRAGVSETKVRTGMTAATGAIMEGLARHAHNSSVMDDTVQLVDRTPEVSDPLVAVEEDDRMRSASNQMLGLATNDTSGVTKRLASSLGVGTGVASTLLAAASSIILNGLHRFSRARGGMDSTALSATLLAEAPGFFAAMPGPVPSSWRERERRIERPAARSHERRWLWLLALIPIVAIGAWLINRHERGERRNATPMGKVTEPDRMAPQQRAITPPAPEPKSVVPEEPAPMPERQTMPDQTQTEPTPGEAQLQPAQWQLPLPSDQDQQVSGAESPAIGVDAQQAQESDQVSGAESQVTGDAQQAQESSENQQAMGPEAQQEQQTNQGESTESQQEQQRKQDQQAMGPESQQEQQRDQDQQQGTTSQPGELNLSQPTTGTEPQQEQQRKQEQQATAPEAEQGQESNQEPSAQERMVPVPGMQSKQEQQLNQEQGTESQQDQQRKQDQQATAPEAEQGQESNQEPSATGTESQQDQQREQEQQTTPQAQQEQQRPIPVPGMESQQVPQPNQSQQDQQRKQEQQAQGEQQPQQPQQPPVEINPGTPPSEQPPVEINPGTPAGQPQEESKPPVTQPEQPSAGTQAQTTQPSAPEGDVAAAIEAQIESPNPPEEGVTLDELKFDSGRAQIKENASASEQLSRVAEILDANPNVRIQINGYTDLTGNKDANMKLSQKRAEAAKEALMQRGIDGSRIEAKGRGGEEPMEETPVQSDANRRVTVLVVSR
ncbi:MAG TPA: OmpA family protein [Kofleriaceae bacterium]|nr:OmpA family protein [Kofleriaceae bacterium]